MCAGQRALPEGAVCSTKYRTMRQCVAGVKESNFSMVARLEAKDECRSAMDAIKQSPLYHCRCKRGMKKEKNCLRIYWGIYQTLQGNDFLEDSPYEPVNSRLSDIFRLAPIIERVKDRWRRGGEERHRKKQERWEPPERSLETHNDDGERGREANVAQRVKDKHQTPLCCPGETAGLTDESRAESNRKYKCLKFMRLIQRERRQTDGEPAVARENNCLNAAKACNLNDTCKKYRSAYISPCTSRVSSAEVCNKRKCHKALRQFFDKVPPKHSYGMLYCSCPVSDQSACSERRRQTIVPVCSYEEKQKPNCLELQASCKTNYICRSRLADFFVNCQPEPRSLSGCLKRTTPTACCPTPVYVSPFCDCNNSGNNKDECDKLTEFFTENTCLRNAIQAFGNGTDAQKLKSNSTVDGVFCVDPQIDNPSTSNAILRNSAVSRWDAASLLPPW
ncbi:hypothetical protein F7725_023662 [Dissostichus mawsoni]|uniref:GDNF family receptor alpha n=1 Tax=Dissostichus mawsoni TaxID=36200 RepID=A0A7J5XXW5_DISMA|nr:hypothetical protein F7725_023662 [Dissostichus mawsoni]